MENQHDDNILNEFIEESRDHLESIEPDLLAMEKEGADVSPEVVNRIFRAMHSIKGSSGFFGFEALKELSHVMENVLMKFRDGELTPSPDKMDALLAGIDKSREMIEDVYASNNVLYTDELEALNDILENKKREHLPEEDKNIIVENTGGSDDAIMDFSRESHQHLDDVIQCILSIRQQGIEKSSDILKKSAHAFRIIKNGSQFFNFQSLQEISTVFETIFFNMMSGKLVPDSGQIETIIDGVGYVCKIFENLATSDDISHENALKKIKVLIQEKPAPDQNSDISPEPDNTETLEQTKTDKTPPSKKNETQSTSTETIRINLDLIDSMMNLAGELVLSRNQLRQENENSSFKNSKMNSIIQDVDVVTSEIQEKIMQMRMQPVGNLLNKFTRVVRDLSRQLSKEVDLIIEGKDIELDKTILEGLSDPLTHLVRNCLDHGIETPEEREKFGKPRSGKLTIRTFHEGGQVNILVRDDGKGIDADKIVAKAITNGVISLEKAGLLNEKEKNNLILLPGMSTAEEITDISGRGVGMDVVKTNIEKLGGYLELDTYPGRGTSVRIRLPLTLAIMPSLIVGSEKKRFAIPQVNVQELILIKASTISQKIEKIGTAEVLRLRERLLPLVNLAEVLGMKKTYKQPVTENLFPDRRKHMADRRGNHPGTENELNKDRTEENIHTEQRITNDRRKSWRNDINVVVMKLGANIFGLTVDELFDNEEIVVKPLSTHIKDCKCFAGATIMGDGRVAMILDVMGISEMSNLRFAEINAEETRRREREEIRAKSQSDQQESILLFNNALEEFFALPLDSISRLELISPDIIYTSGDRNYINYRNETLPLVYLENFLPIRPFPRDLDEFYLIIPKSKDYSIGIIVSRILDTVDTTVAVKKNNATPKGLLGSAFVEGQLTMFLNTYELMEIISNKTNIEAL